MMNRLKLLFTILDEDYDDEIKEIYDKNNLSVRFLTHGFGTASSSILDYFGLVETKKHVHMTLIADYMEEKICRQIDKKIHLSEPGTGIVFSVSLSSANKFLVDEFKKNDVEKEGIVMNNVKKNYLIITIVLEGHLEQVMAAAKRVGVSGGTVIRGIGLGDKSAVKFFGFEIEPGRELVLNIVDASIKNKVMEEITKEVGIKTSAKGICLAVLVDNVIGMHVEDDTIKIDEGVVSGDL